MAYSVRRRNREDETVKSRGATIMSLVAVLGVLSVLLYHLVEGGKDSCKCYTTGNA